MHIRLLLTHVSSPFNNASLMINILFWLALPPSNWPQSSAEVKNEWSCASFPHMCLHCLDRNDFTPSFVSSFLHKGLMILMALPTHFLPWRIYVFLNKWQKFLYDRHFFLFHLETVGCGVNNMFVKMIFVHNIVGNYYFFWWLQVPLILFSVVLLCSFMNALIALHSVMCGFCLCYLLSDNSLCFCLHVWCICI